MDATFVTIGVVAVLAAIAGGGLSAAGVSVPVIASVARQVLLGLVGVVLVAGGLTMRYGLPSVPDVGAFGGQGDQAGQGDQGGGEPADGGAAAPGGAAEPPVPEDTAGGGGEPEGGCSVDVTFPFAEIRDEADHGSLVVSAVPEGTYAVSESTVASWGGRDERWFRLEVDGRTGWILDDPMLLTKSGACP